MNDVLFLGRMTGCDLIFSGIPKMPLLGQEIFSQAFHLKIGGSANTPIASAKLGLRVGLLTEIGSDMLGDFLMGELRRFGVDMTFVRQVEEMQTCVSAVLSTAEDRGFVSFVDERAGLTVSQIRQAMPSARYVYTDLEHCVRDDICGATQDARAGLIVDCSYNDALRLRDVAEILACTALFTANQSEAEMLTGESDPVKALELLARHADTAVVKLGRRGCIGMQRGTLFQTREIPGIEAVDTTGAGDAFGAGLLYAMLHGMDFQSGLQFANAAGALAVTYCGGMDDAFTLENVWKLHEKAYGRGIQ